MASRKNKVEVTSVWPNGDVTTRPMEVAEEAKPAIAEIFVTGDRRLVTIGPDCPIWSSEPVALDLGDAIVRLVPPDNALDSTVERVEAWARRLGASAVKTLPRRRTPGTIGHVVDVETRQPHLKAREVVEAVSREMASRIDADPNAPHPLLKFVEDVMARSGL